MAFGVLFAVFAAALNSHNPWLLVPGCLAYLLLLLLLSLYAAAVTPRKLGLTDREFRHLSSEVIAEEQSKGAARAWGIGRIFVLFAIVLVSIAQSGAVGWLYEALGPALAASLAGVLGGVLAFVTIRLWQRKAYEDAGRLRGIAQDSLSRDCDAPSKGTCS